MITTNCPNCGHPHQHSENREVVESCENCLSAYTSLATLRDGTLVAEWDWIDQAGPHSTRRRLQYR